ncbi:MAG: hypothetical protein SNJ75_09400 [Gemmataceae bacterium]
MITLLLLFLDEAPLIGRPVEWPFSQAVAGFVRQEGRFVLPFSLQVEASPTQLNSDEPLILSVTVRALGPVKKPPARLALDELPAFAKAFHLSDWPNETGDPTPSSPATLWRWRYRLVPRGPWVSEIPSVPFLFYNPDFTPPERGYQLLFAEPIPLRVRPPEKLGPPPDYPPSVMQPLPDSELTRSVSRWQPDGRSAVVAVLGPPLICLLGWWLWQRCNPDAARLAALRKQRAARQALDALHRTPRDPRAAAEHLVAVLTTYLRDRYQLRSQTPTPVEVATTLARMGAETLAKRVAEWWQQADAVRFGQQQQPLSVSAVRTLLRELEEAICRSSS